MNQQKQIDNANEVEEFLKNKYTNEELYSWMRGSLKTLYHQVYNLAYDLAKKQKEPIALKGVSAMLILFNLAILTQAGRLTGRRTIICGFKTIGSSLPGKAGV